MKGMKQIEEAFKYTSCAYNGCGDASYEFCCGN